MNRPRVCFRETEGSAPSALHASSACEHSSSCQRRARSEANVSSANCLPSLVLFLSFPLALSCLSAALSTSAVAAPGDVDPDFDPNALRRSPTVLLLSTTMQPDHKIVIGGSFDVVGGATGVGIARLNPNGAVDSSFTPRAESVYCTAIQADGKILIGGGFSRVAGITRNNLARLNVEGTLDTDFNPNANGVVYTTTLQPDGKVIIAGAFGTVSGTARNRMARLNADGSLDTGFDPNVSGTLVSSTALQADGKIIVGGSFGAVSGTSRRDIARLNTDGTLDTGFNPSVNGWVLCATVQADGRIVIGGQFVNVGGSGYNYLARLNTDGTVDVGFDHLVAAVSPFVYSAVLQADGKIVIAGYFTRINQITHNRVARLNSDGTLDPSFNADFSADALSAAVQADGKIIIGGRFSLIARYLNDPATQNLAVPSAGRLEWLRGGASPEAQYVTFELSTDGGATWSALGTGTRILGGWELTGLSLPDSGKVRARARVTGGQYNGSSGLVETVATYSLSSVPSVRLTSPTLLSNGAFQFGFTNLSGIPFTALATTNLTLPSSNWTVLGTATEIFPGQFQFTDSAATNFPWRFYQIRSP